MMSGASDSNNDSFEECPKCGGKMVDGRCATCNFSHDAAISPEEAREVTAPG